MDKISVQTVCNDKFANRLNLTYLDMKQMISNSDESKIRLNLEFNPHFWFLCSVHDSIHAYFIGLVIHRVAYNYIKLDFGILPVCTI